MTEIDVDAIIIGAGFGGLRTLHEFRRLGLSTILLEAGSDVGGTWYWNSYPGARTDSEAWIYAMSHSEEILQEWDWTHRFPRQEEVQRYLSFATDRLGLREDIRFDSHVDAAAYDEDSSTWTVTLAEGDTLSSRYVVFATGLLSATYVPPFDGLDEFKGERYLSARWPKKEAVSFDGKRVGIIGTGATGVQLVPEVGRLAEHLTVFQRTPNYVLPGRNHPIDDAQRAEIKRDYATIWERCHDHFYGFDMTEPVRNGADMSPEELRATFDVGWERGGFHFVFETVADLFTNPEINEAACEYIREKIRAIVKDPETAELLCPRYPLMAKRPPLGHSYYEMYNRPNVEIVDVSTAPIERITPTGVKTAEAEYELDMIILATGFDAGTGALTSIDIRGRGGRSLREKWVDGPRTYLGIAIDEFPNLFMISGPQTVFSNIPLVIDFTATWIGRLMARMEREGMETAEATAEAVEAWSGRLERILSRPSILTAGIGVRSWNVGANIPGKPHKALFLPGNLDQYADVCSQVESEGFEGFTFGVPSTPRVGEMLR